MRIPYPQSIPLRPLLLLLAMVLLVQLMQGTDPLFGVLMLVAQFAAAIAFNYLGGMSHMAGAFCLFAVLPNVTVPELTHLILGQPGDYNLEYPVTTAGVCAVFFICVMVSGVVLSFLRPPVPYLDRIPFSLLELRIISGISAAFAAAMAIAVLSRTEQVEDGSLLAALNHFYPFLLAISVMLATYARVKSTDGRSCMNWYVACLLVVAIVPGILSASKEGMLTPVFCWFVVVAASGYRFTRLGAAVVFGFAFLLWTYVYPYSQNARFPVREAASISEKVQIIVQFFRDPSQFPDSLSSFEESSEFGTASSKVNIVKRYSLLQSIDMLVAADKKAGYTSFSRYAPALLAFVPHALWPDRPEVISTNELGHKAGFNIAESDTITGLAIGGPALYFDLGGWVALASYTIFCFSIFFFVTLRLVGSTANSIWGIVPIGTEALIAGAASPAAMFNLVITLLGTFFVAVAVLKLISYFAKTLISRPLPSRT